MWGKEGKGKLDYLCLAKSASDVSKEGWTLMAGLGQPAVTEHSVQQEVRVRKCFQRAAFQVIYYFLALNMYIYFPPPTQFMQL